jgi:hypothetical protein
MNTTIKAGRTNPKLHGNDKQFDNNDFSAFERWPREQNKNGVNRNELQANERFGLEQPVELGRKRNKDAIGV